MDVSIIIVSWNVQGLLRNCLRSVYRSLADSSIRAEVIAVDNNSVDGSAAMVAREFPQATLIRNVDNLGFTRANNQGLARAEGRYALLLNPDAELTPGALGALLEYAESRPEVGVVGPKLVFGDGSVQSSRRRFPTLMTGLIESTVLQRFVPDHPALRRYYVLDVPNDRAQEVDWVVGACLLVRREALSKVGAFDERFFMYSEELDLCYRIKKAGWKVIYFPEAQVVHHEARSSEQNLMGRNIYFHDSKCKFFGKHYGAGQGLLLRCVVVLSFAFQIVEDLLKLLVVSRNREMRKGRIGMLARVAKWHLRRIVPWPDK
ncbi:MAG: glycosyltransferase family 2 protein [Chloroflexi bacterium]|nr:glycosyltransferase family 2 protein [Chloroflexota bacterium]